MYLFSIDDVHDDAALEHSCESSLDCESVLAILSTGAIGCREFSCHCRRILQGLDIECLIAMATKKVRVRSEVQKRGWKEQVLCTKKYREGECESIR